MLKEIELIAPDSTPQQRRDYLEHMLRNDRKFLAQIEERQAENPEGYVVICTSENMFNLPIGTDPNGGLRVTGTLFASVLPTMTDAEILRERFRTAGDMQSVHVNYMLETERQRQLAKIQKIEGALDELSKA